VRLARHHGGAALFWHDPIEQQEQRCGGHEGQGVAHRLRSPAGKGPGLKVRSQITMNEQGWQGSGHGGREEERGEAGNRNEPAAAGADEATVRDPVDAIQAVIECADKAGANLDKPDEAAERKPSAAVLRGQRRLQRLACIIARQGPIGGMDRRRQRGIAPQQKSTDRDEEQKGRYERDQSIEGDNGRQVTGTHLPKAAHRPTRKDRPIASDQSGQPGLKVTQ
jgi:hypothetical protein